MFLSILTLVSLVSSTADAVIRTGQIGNTGVRNRLKPAMVNEETEIWSVLDSSCMMDEVFRENRTSFAVLTVVWIVVIVAIIFLPDTIPAHWSDSTEPDRWGSKFELLIAPTLFTIICLACMGVTRVVKGETYGDGKSSELFMHRTTIVISIFFLLLELGILTLVIINL